MSFLLVKSFSSFLFVGDHCFTLHVVNDLCLYFVLHIGANCKLSIAFGEQYFEFNLVTGITLQVRYI